ncbi:hypothetical protein [Tabrizicola sp.]|uniref:hypothetical protein n=1 Tax=Tabrizicola sp. TaxID=2005166 RepID=UPI003F3AA411
MSDASAPPASPIRVEIIIFAIIFAMAMAGLAYVLSQRQQELRSSPVGLDGLQLWLTAEDVSTQTFSGGWIVDPVSIGLVVLPLHDTDPDQELQPARTKEELLFQQDENDLDWYSIFDKVEQAPTLIVLPKWRSGMRLTGLAHPALLVERDRLDGILQYLTGEQSIRVNYSRQVFTALPYQDATGAELRAEIYAAQLFDSTGCDPIIGSGRETLLASCPVAGSYETVFVLSDPDLLNNHGLRLGQNAAIARDFLAGVAGDGTVLIDYSRDNWFFSTDEPIQRDRTWADLLRFFEPPFLALWLGAGMMLALVLWRSLRRAGPVAHVADAGTGKMQAIQARARLMRLTGQDGAMMGDYAHARIAATAARLVGPGHARQIGEEHAFVRFVARRRKDLADRLEAALARLHALPATISATAAIHHVEDLEQILELIANDT